MRRDSLFLIGLTDRPEFRFLTVNLSAEAKCAGTEILIFPTIGSAIQNGADNVRLVVLLESRPGEYPPRSVDRLRLRALGAVILLVAGPLCEGEGRTGRLPAGVIRRYWHETGNVFPPELKRFLNHEPSRLSLPATATEEDFWRAVRINRPTPASMPLTRTAPNELPETIVVTADPGMYELLAGLEARCGGCITRLTSTAELIRHAQTLRPQKIIIDLTEQVQTFLPILKKAGSFLPETEYVIYAFAPTPKEMTALNAAVQKIIVMPKPFACVCTPYLFSY